MVQRIVVMMVVALAWTGAGRLAGEEAGIPPEFDYVGSYRLQKRVKVREGRTLSIAISLLDYRVYTDGISLRFYGRGDDTAFTSFEVYRTDGVARLRDDSLLESVPGVQARSMVGQVLRQVTLTAERMTLTKFPALGDAVEITYAVRIPEENKAPTNASVQP